jgi:uncharacterized integral membrane protein
MLLLIVCLIICIPLIVFALSNTQVVSLTMWPTDYHWDVPLSLAILSAMGLAFILGGLLVWFSVLAQRRRARRAERTARLLRAEVEQLKTRPQPEATLALPPAA